MTFLREWSLPVLGGSTGSLPVIIPRQTPYKQKRPRKNQWIFHENQQFFEGFGIPGIAGSLILIFLKYPKLTVLWFWFFFKKIWNWWKIIESHNIGFYLFFWGCTIVVLSNVVWFLLQKAPSVQFSKLVLWISKTFDFNHFHKEFKTAPIQDQDRFISLTHT
jgi:hypothetical protein